MTLTRDVVVVNKLSTVVAQREGCRFDSHPESVCVSLSLQVFPKSVRFCSRYLLISSRSPTQTALFGLQEVSPTTEAVCLYKSALQ